MNRLQIMAEDTGELTPTREKLLDATVRCIERHGISSIGIAGVASEAGVSRPTVYRYFNDRRDLVQATLMRAAYKLNKGLAQRLWRFKKPSGKAVEAVIFSLEVVANDPVLSAVWRHEALDAAALEGFMLAPSITFARGAFHGLEEAAAWNEAEAQEATEVILRFMLSLLAAPGPKRTPRELRRFLERRLVPALGL